MGNEIFVRFIDGPSAGSEARDSSVLDPELGEIRVPRPGGFCIVYRYWMTAVDGARLFRMTELQLPREETAKGR